MNNKEDLVKQVIILSLILVFVIIVAIVLNTRNSNDKKNVNIPEVRTEIINNTKSQKELTQEEKMKENLKGLLEEPDEEYYLQEELNDKNETVVTTKNGETIIIKD